MQRRRIYAQPLWSPDWRIHIVYIYVWQYCGFLHRGIRASLVTGVNVFVILYGYVRCSTVDASSKTAADPRLRMKVNWSLTPSKPTESHKTTLWMLRDQTSLFTTSSWWWTQLYSSSWVVLENSLHVYTQHIITITIDIASSKRMQDRVIVSRKCKQHKRLVKT